MSLEIVPNSGLIGPDSGLMGPDSGLSIATIATASADALDQSARRMAAVMSNATNYTPGQLQAKITEEYAVDNFVNANTSKLKKNIEQIGTIGR
jgi:hypothetical protein